MHFSAPPGTPRRFRAHVLGGHVLGGLVLGAVALVAVVSPLAVLAAPASAGTVTAATVIKEAKAAIASQSSAHVEFAASSTTSSSTEQFVADVGASGGRDTVTDGAAVLHVIVTPADGYISGSASGLSLFGLTSAEAKKVGKRWEFWKKGTKQYKNLESVVSVKSLESLLPKSKGTTLTTKGSDYVLTWTSAASGSTPKLSNTLSVTAKGTTLPVAETSTDGSGEKVTTSISKWGEAVVVHAPAASSVVAASAVAG